MDLDVLLAAAGPHPGASAASSTSYELAPFKGELRQAPVADLKTIAEALEAPLPDKPDAEAAWLALGSALTVIVKLLCDGAATAWHPPHTMFELIVLFAACLTAYAQIRKYFKNREKLREWETKSLNASAKRLMAGILGEEQTKKFRELSSPKKS
jgi:hypothetical protein